MFNLKFCVDTLKSQLNPDSTTSPHRYMAFGYGNNITTNASTGALTGFTEVTATSANHYARVHLNALGLEGNTLLTGRVNQSSSSSAPLTTTQTVSIDNAGGTPIVTDEQRTVALVQNTNEFIMAAYTGEDDGVNTGWGTVNAFVIYDASSGGTALCYGTFTPVVVGPNVVPIILKQKFNVTLG